MKTKTVIISSFVLLAAAVSASATTRSLNHGLAHRAQKAQSVTAIFDQVPLPAASLSAITDSIGAPTARDRSIGPPSKRF